MERIEKLEFVERLMASDFKITKEAAHKIIRDLDIEDKAFEYYAEDIQTEEERIKAEEEKEIAMNWNLYHGDIHGGV